VVAAAEFAAASAAAIAMWPAFRALVRATGRRATVGAVAAWLAVGLLLTPGTRRIENVGDSSLWLIDARLAVANAAVGLLLIPTFAGLVLAQARLRAVRGGAPSEVTSGKAGALIVELLWLRTALHRFLISFAVVISGSVMAAGAYRAVLLADGLPPDKLPVVGILTYGAYKARILDEYESLDKAGKGALLRSGGGNYVLPIKRAIRKAEALDVGDRATVTVQLIDF